MSAVDASDRAAAASVGRQTIGLPRTLCMYALQLRYGLVDETLEDAL